MATAAATETTGLSPGKYDVTNDDTKPDRNTVHGTTNDMPDRADANNAATADAGNATATDDGANDTNATHDAATEAT